MSTSFSTGRSAEQFAAEYLAKKGYKVLDKNWRTRFCEIDIVAKKNNIIHFVEVKFRRNNRHGSGLEAINFYKLRKMQFSAEIWVSANNWKGKYQLAAIGVYPNGTVEFIDQIDCL